MKSEFRQTTFKRPSNRKVHIPLKQQVCLHCQSSSTVLCVFLLILVSIFLIFIGIFTFCLLQGPQLPPPMNIYCTGATLKTPPQSKTSPPLSPPPLVKVKVTASRSFFLFVCLFLWWQPTSKHTNSQSCHLAPGKITRIQPIGNF